MTSLCTDNCYIGHHYLTVSYVIHTTLILYLRVVVLSLHAIISLLSHHSNPQPENYLLVFFTFPMIANLQVLGTSSFYRRSISLPNISSWANPFLVPNRGQPSFVMEKDNYSYWRGVSQGLIPTRFPPWTWPISSPGCGWVKCSGNRRMQSSSTGNSLCVGKICVKTPYLWTTLIASGYGAVH